MPRFAIYYVPPKESEFYRLGSQIVGYDVRARKLVKLGKDLKKLLGRVDTKWVKHARPFGFHLTIGDAIDFEGDIKEIKQDIEREIEIILNCFNPSHWFELTMRKENFVTIYRTKRGDAIVLRYDPNEYLKLFSTLVVSRVNTLGTGSGFLKRFKEDPAKYYLHHGHRILNFYAPYIFDDYSPHFTLLDPYTGNDHDRLRRTFSKIFRPFSHMYLDTICLLFQKERDKNWEICREFDLNCFPKPL
ncbi:MAG: hypothetical protein AYK18_13890 [Theionarchaea archaeon DG-70]|nr:MAG: hypothetical protein AYK18_13890 [Theionarchaea archaeon DG-70]